MIISENIAAILPDELRSKFTELDLIVRANRLHRELENQTLEEVLDRHLPASESPSTAAQDIDHAIDEVYAGLDKKVSDAQLEALLNQELEGLDCNQRGKYLVNLLHSAAATGIGPLRTDPEWLNMKDADTFSAEDVSVLMDLVMFYIDNNAGFIARQEFAVMSGALEALPQHLVEAQIDSGAQYARAYAAAMYITSRQNPDLEPLTPYQMGFLAAQSVESSRILALYHYGRLRLEDAMKKLKVLAKRMLVQVAAVALRAAVASLAATALFSIVTTLGVSCTGFLLAAIYLFAIVAFMSYDQEDAVNDLARACEAVKGIIDRIKAFFRGGHAPGSGGTGIIIDNNDNDTPPPPPGTAPAITIGV